MIMAKLCTYCGNKPGITKDHVIPKNIFPKPRPNDLVTVKCCKDCNNKFKKDEDIFVAWINLGPGGATKEGQSLWNQKLYRTYKKDYGVRKIIANSFKHTNLVTPGGIYLGKRLAILIDSKRLNNVLKKIIRGLFWIEYKERLPQNVRIDILGIHKNDERITEVIHATEPAITCWEKLFEYRHRRLDASTLESLWIMSFYRENYFVAIVDEIANIV